VRVTITRPADERPLTPRKRIVQSTRRDDRRAHLRAGSTAKPRHHGIALHVSRATCTAAARARVFVSVVAAELAAGAASATTANATVTPTVDPASGVLRTLFSVNRCRARWADNLRRANDGGEQ
jgi:hypothetical protein